VRRGSRRFGIEFEFECSWERLRWYASRAVNKIYGKGRYYAKKDRFTSDFELDKWHIKEENNGVAELTTPVSRLRDIRSICEVIKSFHGKFQPQDDCGLHVHIDVSDLDQYHIMGAWLLCERGIIRCFPQSRRRSGFCEKIISDPHVSRNLIAKILEAETDSASHGDAVDFTEYSERKTIEFRLSEGSMDVEWIRSWITFLLYWIDFVKKKNPSLIPCEKCNSIAFDSLLDELNLDDRTREVMEDRYEKYRKGPYWS